jgi:hypothetical protein
VIPFAIFARQAGPGPVPSPRKMTASVRCCRSGSQLLRAAPSLMLASRGDQGLQADVLAVRDGKVAGWREYQDSAAIAEALNAGAGLPQQH